MKLDHRHSAIFNTARNHTWIFTLDADELPDDKLLARLGRMADTSHGVMVYWLRRKNLVDGVDIFPILKEDWQPRLFKKNALRYGDRMHTHPQPQFIPSRRRVPLKSLLLLVPKSHLQ